MGVVIEICVKHPRGPLERRGLVLYVRLLSAAVGYYVTTRYYHAALPYL
jgi:hypothetical protein